MQSIIKNEKVELTVKNSKFIGLSFNVESKEEIKEKLKEVKMQYKNASHYCYAFNLINEKGLSDDNEPNKTAGVPILQTIEANNLVNILIVVVRYFKGIKLGTGGLIRAYSKTSKDLIDKCEKISLIKGYQITITFPYDKEKNIAYILKESNIKKKIYDKEITYIVDIKEKDLEHLKTHAKIIQIQEKIIPNIN